MPGKGYKNFYKFDGQADCLPRAFNNELLLRPYRPGSLLRSAQGRDGVPQGKKIPQRAGSKDAEVMKEGIS